MNSNAVEKKTLALGFLAIGILTVACSSDGSGGMIGGGVAVGGGAGLFPKITDFAQNVFKVPARVGLPQEIPGMHKEWLTPRHLTVFGLLYAAQRKNQVPDSRTPMFELVGREVKKIAELLGRAMRF